MKSLQCGHTLTESAWLVMNSKTAENTCVNTLTVQQLGEMVRWLKNHLPKYISN